MVKFIITIIVVMSLVYLYIKFIYPIYEDYILTLKEKQEEPVVFTRHIGAMQPKELIRIVIAYKNKKKGVTALERIKRIDYTLYNKLNQKYNIVS